MSDYTSKYVDVLGSKMHYLEAGEGDPIVFLHGVPTSSYVWRKIIPHLAPLGRCIAPDLIGFGQSDRPDIAYSISDHISYMASFIAALNLNNITFIMQGWGSIIGFHYAMGHEKSCRALVFYEAFLRSVVDENVSLPFQEQILSFDAVDTTMTTGIQFVDTVLPQLVMRELTQADMDHYRRPFIESGSDQPIAQYMKELPRGDGKSEADALIADYSAKLQKSKLPKLMLYSIPGFITPIATAIWAKEHLPNLEIIDIGEELHLGQESCPDLMGEAISIWLQGVEQNS